MFSPDKPIKHSQDDLLGRKGFAQNLAQALMSFNTSDTYTVGVFWKMGHWKDISCQHGVGGNQE